MEPVSWLSLRPNPPSLVRLPSSFGIVPVSWLWAMPNPRRLVRLPRAGGMVVNRFPPISNDCRLVRLPNRAGMLPINLLLWRLNLSRLLRLPSAGGIVPVSWLRLRSNVCSWERLPSAAGMVLVSWLSLRFKYVRLVRVPSAAGMVPVSCLRLSSNPVTREMVTVTPSQAVMGVVVVQFREAAPQWVLILRSVEQSATKLGSSGSGIARLFAHELVVCCAATGVDAPATRMKLLMVKIAQRREMKSFMSVSSLGRNSLPVMNYR